jgi:hypothetical protein
LAVYREALSTYLVEKVGYRCCVYIPEFSIVWAIFDDLDRFREPEVDHSRRVDMEIQSEIGQYGENNICRLVFKKV